MIFYDTFELGGLLLAVMLLLLGAFSACINLLITKECSSMGKLAPLVLPNNTIDMENTDMHVSDLDSSLKDTTITSVVTMGAVNTSVQSAPVNIDELKRKKLLERRNNMPKGTEPRHLTSSPKPKSNLVLSEKQRCPSPSAR